MVVVKKMGQHSHQVFWVIITYFK
uniref:Uncharacterized protein n=1 Tax=Anguilla anguilla TaxID=7936 RepID=A0A0E9W7J9_ANGAN